MRIYFILFCLLGLSINLVCMRGEAAYWALRAQRQSRPGGFDYGTFSDDLEDPINSVIQQNDSSILCADWWFSSPTRRRLSATCGAFCAVLGLILVSAVLLKLIPLDDNFFSRLWRH